MRSLAKSRLCLSQRRSTRLRHTPRAEPVTGPAPAPKDERPAGQVDVTGAKITPRTVSGDGSRRDGGIAKRPVSEATRSPSLPSLTRRLMARLKDIRGHGTPGSADMAAKAAKSSIPG